MNKYKFSFLVTMLFLTNSLFALDGVFFGLGGEANGNTRQGVAAGGVVRYQLPLFCGVLQTWGTLWVVSCTMCVYFMKITRN